MVHEESGAIGRATDSRSQKDNEKKAFERLCAHPKMKVWIGRKVFELQEKMTLEESVARDMDLKNLKFEVRDENGNWKEVKQEEIKD
jgi:hypothetical protein